LENPNVSIDLFSAKTLGIFKNKAFPNLNTDMDYEDVMMIFNRIAGGEKYSLLSFEFKLAQFEVKNNLSPFLMIVPLSRARPRIQRFKSRRFHFEKHFISRLIVTLCALCG